MGESGADLESFGSSGWWGPRQRMNRGGGANAQWFTAYHRAKKNGPQALQEFLKYNNLSPRYLMPQLTEEVIRECEDAPLPRFTCRLFVGVE